MLKIDNNQNITLTRGDTLTLTVGLFQEVEGEVVPYVPAAGDVIRFAVSQGYKGQSSYELKLSKDIDNSTLTFTCSSAETALDYETYNYDVETYTGTWKTCICVSLMLLLLHRSHFLLYS